MKKYKPYKKQQKECLDNGTAFEEKIGVVIGPVEEDINVIMCKKYGGQCRSSKCLDDRITIIEPQVIKNDN